MRCVCLVETTEDASRAAMGLQGAQKHSECAAQVVTYLVQWNPEC